MIYITHKDSVLTSLREHRATIRRISRLMLCGEIIVVSYKNRTKHKNAVRVCCKNTDFFFPVQRGDTYSNQRALKG